MESHDCTDTISLASHRFAAHVDDAVGTKQPWLNRLWNAPVVVLASIGNCLYTWQDRSDQRMRLRRMDDRTLNDIGLSRTEAEREGNKPFWVA